MHIFVAGTNLNHNTLLIAIHTSAIFYNDVVIYYFEKEHDLFNVLQ